MERYMLAPLSTVIDGERLDDKYFTTISVEGRFEHKRTLDVRTVSGIELEHVIATRRPSTVLTVNYLLTTPNTILKRDRVNKLKNLLGQDKVFRLRFGDEKIEYVGYPYYLARCVEFRPPSEQYWQGVGSIKFVCDTPYKYYDLELVSGKDAIVVRASDGNVNTSFDPLLITALLDEPSDQLVISSENTGSKIVFNREFEKGDAVGLAFDRNIFGIHKAPDGLIDLLPYLDYTQSDLYTFDIRCKDRLASDTIRVTPSARLQGTFRAKII